MPRKQLQINQWFIDCKPTSDERADRIRERLIADGSASVIQLVMTLGDEHFSFDGVLTSGQSASNIFFAPIVEMDR